MNRHRWKIGGAIALTVLALVALASGLSSLNLGAGKPLPRLDLFQWGAPTGTPPQTPTGFAPILRVLIGIAFWILLPLSIVYLVLSADARRRLWRQLMAIASFVLIVFLVFNFLQVLNIGSPEDLDPGNPGAGSGATRSADPPDFISQPPDWIILIVSGVIFAVLGFGIWRAWQQRAGAQLDEDSLEDELAQEAESALDALRSGQDLSNVVLRCYRDMEHAIQRAHGLNRRASMTPREFERRLVSAGFPVDAVSRLTRLFERVRYGNQDVEASDEADAEACLAAIAGEPEARSPA